MQWHKMHLSVRHVMDAQLHVSNYNQNLWLVCDDKKLQVSHVVAKK